MTLPERFEPEWPVVPLSPTMTTDTRTGAWFVRTGEMWAVGYAGDSVYLRDSKGMRYLARLLAAPGRAIPALELASPAWSGSAAAIDRGLELSGPEDVWEPTIDTQARAAYGARILELQHSIDEAERHADLERAAREQDELDAIVSHLSAELGLSGRVRVSTSPSERARQSVTKAVKSALRRIAAEHRRLADHLDRTVRTGRYCSYDPEPALQPRWVVRD